VFSAILFFHKYNKSIKVLAYRCTFSQKSYTRSQGRVVLFSPTYFLLTHLFSSISPAGEKIPQLWHFLFDILLCPIPWFCQPSLGRCRGLGPGCIFVGKLVIKGADLGPRGLE